MVLAATASSVYAGLGSHTLHSFYALAVLALAAATSRMKVKLPGIEGNMSVNLPFLLMAVINLSAVEAILIAGLSTVVQCWRTEKKFRPEQMLFNVSMMAFAASMANLLWNAGWLGKASWSSLSVTLSANHGRLLLGADGSSGGHHQADAEHIDAACLDEHRTTVIPLLRGKCGITSMLTLVAIASAGKQPWWCSP